MCGKVQLSTVDILHLDQRCSKFWMSSLKWVQVKIKVSESCVSFLEALGENPFLAFSSV